MDQIRVQVMFSKRHNGVDFTDAVYFTEEEWETKKNKPQEIEAAKTERFENWKTAIEEASQQETPIEIIND
jgi:hypothetical protein